MKMILGLDSYMAELSQHDRRLLVTQLLRRAAYNTMATLLPGEKVSSCSFQVNVVGTLPLSVQPKKVTDAYSGSALGVDSLMGDPDSFSTRDIEIGAAAATTPACDGACSAVELLPKAAL